MRETIKNIKPLIDEFKVLFEDADPPNISKKAYVSLKNSRDKNEKVKNP